MARERAVWNWILMRSLSCTCQERVCVCDCVCDTRTHASIQRPSHAPICFPLIHTLSFTSSTPLLQNMFSYYRVCSLIIEYTSHLLPPNPFCSSHSPSDPSTPPISPASTACANLGQSKGTGTNSQESVSSVAPYLYSKRAHYVVSEHIL